MDDDMTTQGICPRWAQVYAVGPEVVDVKVGDYVMVAHGRWSRGITMEDDTGTRIIRKVDPNDILLVSDTFVQDYTLSDKVM